MPTRYDFYKTKYGKELLIDLIEIRDLEKYIVSNETHTLSYYDITIILEGKGALYIDHHKCPLKKGSVIFTKPGQVRKWECTKTPKGFALIFEEEFLCSFFNDSKFIRNLSCFQGNAPEAHIILPANDLGQAEGILNNISAEINFNIDFDNHMLRALLYQLIIWLDRNFKTKVGITEKPVSRYISEFTELVDIKFHEQHQVCYYADKLNITSGHLNDVIKKEMNTSAKQFIQNRILLEAKRLLSYTDLSVTEISWKLGYTDSSYFVRLFKKQAGITPSRFRKSNP